MKKISLLIIAITFLFSCKKIIDGGYPDTIKMERDEITFGPKNDTVTFKTKGNFYILNPDMSNWPVTHNLTYVNTSYETVHDTVYYDWVKVIALKDDYIVKVVVFDNETGSDREYNASLQDKGFYGYLKIYQDSKCQYFR